MKRPCEDPQMFVLCMACPLGQTLLLICINSFSSVLSCPDYKQLNSRRSKELDCEKIRERYYLSCICPKSCAPGIRRGLQMTYLSGGGSEYFLNVGSFWTFTVLFAVTKTIWSCQHPTQKQQVYFGAFCWVNSSTHTELCLINTHLFDSGMIELQRRERL